MGNDAIRSIRDRDKKEVHFVLVKNAEIGSSKAPVYLENLIVSAVTTPQIQLNSITNAGVNRPSSNPAIPILAL